MINTIFFKKYKQEIKKIKNLPNMPDFTSYHIGSTSIDNSFGTSILDILMIVENLHEIIHFDEKRMNYLGYHRISHDKKGIIIFCKINNFINISYDTKIFIVQKDSILYNNFIFFDNLLRQKTYVFTKYQNFKKNNYKLKHINNKKYTKLQEIFIKNIITEDKMIEEIKKLLNDSEIKFDEPLKNYSYTKTGGKATVLVKIKNIEDFKKLLSFTSKNKINTTILGKGSNVLISDNGLDGVTIITENLNKIEILDNGIVSCEAGNTLKELTNVLIENSLSGLEFACGIPGSIGGAVFMNAGAYGGEIKDVVYKVETLTKNGITKTYSNLDMKFNYRYSVIQDNNEIITKVYFKLKKGNREKIKNDVEEYNKRREEKQPLEYPSCGSVFKRPEGHFAGKLIQEAGCQGLSIGGAEVSKKHAGFMINKNNATCEDYKNLIKLVQEKVYKNSGVKLEREVKILGE